MSDDWEVDEEITRQHSRELNEQIGREHSAELDKQRAADEAWPPEGTRVRITNGLYKGMTAILLYPSWVSEKAWVADLAYGNARTLLERHEIEVIGEHDSSHKKTMD